MTTDLIARLKALAAEGHTKDCAIYQRPDEGPLCDCVAGVAADAEYEINVMETTQRLLREMFAKSSWTNIQPRPMSEAPRDGTPILAIWPNGALTPARLEGLDSQCPWRILSDRDGAWCHQDDFVGWLPCPDALAKGGE